MFEEHEAEGVFKGASFGVFRKIFFEIQILHASDDIITGVQNLNLKKDFPKDPETRALEDALCLVFLEHQFADLASKTAEDKMINAVQKTWKKMTEQARTEALKLSYTDKDKKLIEKALASG